MGTLRILLALWVVCTHGQALWGQPIPQAWVAVQCFFIVSGFYMTLILNEKYIGPGSISLFFSNRLLRLYPTYIVVLVLTLAVTGVTWGLWGRALGPVEAWQGYRHALGWHNVPFLAVANAIIFGQNEVHYLRMDGVTGALSWTTNFDLSEPKVWKFLCIPQAWSIGLELLFYLLAPFLVRRSLRVVIGVLAASLLCRAICYGPLALRLDPWTYRFFPNELALFLLGSVSYRIYRARWRERVSEGLWIWVLFAVFFGLTVAFPFIPVRGQLKAWPYYGLATMTLPFLFAETKNWRWDRFIGELSYPIYLVHFLIVWICEAALPASWQWNRSFWVIIGSVALAIGLNQWLVGPLENWRQARVPRAVR